MAVPSIKLIRVLIADDHPLMLYGIANALTIQGGIDVIALANNGAQAIAHFASHHPDVSLIDLQMPISNGLDAIRGIRSIQPEARIVVLTTYSGDARIQTAFDAGASAYLLKDVRGEELASTVRRVHSGANVIGRTARQHLDEHFAADKLSERELDVLRLAADGHSNHIIGDMLGIKESTVKTHMGTILVKLGARDRTHAVTVAINRGYISL